MIIKTQTGTVITLEDKEAQKLIDMGFATEEKEPTAPKKPTTKKAKKESK